ncbi:MAG: polysaccharide deacetylase family protein [Lachnospiraceae bacterium]
MITAFISLERKEFIITSSQIEKKNENLPIYSVDTGEKKYISLTFDAAWGVEDLEQILEILDKHKVKASFFVTGDWVARYPDAIKQLEKKGHDIGNHGDSHKHMTQIGREEQMEEIKKAHNRVKSLIGKEMILFRAPYGDYDEQVVKTARECGYYTIQWDVDSLDWKNYGVKNIVKTVIEHKNLQNGSIVLLHNGTLYTKDALGEIIIELKQKGYIFIPVSKMIYRHQYRMDGTGRQIKT